MHLSSPILAPVVALVAWSLVMWTWMYATRLPAIFKAHMAMDPNAMNQLPPNVRWKADNYNHLMEQPTIFYAIAFALALMGAGGGANHVLAWGYVGLRVVHSLVQAVGNRIKLRFAVFVLSSLILIGLTCNAAVALMM
jgi:hypothetical protein